MPLSKPMVQRLDPRPRATATRRKQRIRMANFELDVPNTPHTKFRLGSITKPFTAMAIKLCKSAAN
jgi:CubicO group peptidase (beta-lactamase class C family)